MQVEIEKLERITNRIEERNKQLKKFIKQANILVASKPKKIMGNGTLKIQ